MAEQSCLVCGSTASMRIIFPHEGPYNFTSALELIPNRNLCVFQCQACSHVQTTPIDNIVEYYSDKYDYNIESSEAEDLYEQVNGHNIYRSDHQLICLKKSIDLSISKRVLDYGCAKAMTLRKLMAERPSLEPFVFDVSDAYTSYWNKFVPKENQATHILPDDWRGSMDVVLSFFALEHANDPASFLNNAANMLRPGGEIHFVIPNMYANYSDILVADHVNHFSRLSLRRLFGDQSFVNLSIDSDSHRAAFIVNAQKTAKPGKSTDSQVAPDAVQQVCAEAVRIAERCRAMAESVRRFEVECATGKAAIYGSGVYGMLILTTLRDRSKLVAILDQNPHRQGKTLLGIPVIAPEALPSDVETLYVGLNPTHARAIVAEQPYLLAGQRRTMFL